MDTMRRRWHDPASWAVMSLLLLAACNGVAIVPSAGGGSTPAAFSAETQAVALTQAGSNAGNQAAAAAEIAGANAQATLDAAATQDQNSADAAAAQLAADVAIERARAEATLAAADSTRSAAVAEDSIRHTQAADLATSMAGAAATQTASVDAITTQTQMAAQLAASQAQQRAADSQAPIAFLWTWCMPPFAVLLGGLALWGFWRWLRLGQRHQEFMDDAMEQLQIPAPTVVNQDDGQPAPYPEAESANDGYQVTQPEDQVQRWLDEVKHELESSDRKDEDHDADN